MSELQLITMSDVETKPVTWLWHPYIPIGKITIMQGDPGDGKTHLILAVTSLLTKGEALPGCEPQPPMNVNQTAEDGLDDTIKPRLEMVNAECFRVQVIDGKDEMLSLSDERILQASGIPCCQVRARVQNSLYTQLHSYRFFIGQRVRLRGTDSHLKGVASVLSVRRLRHLFDSFLLRRSQK